ncbi:hypothetical protein O181_011241 [Austropuccinia psidii MF-1]|uniref:Uncharacterized protein n=1 Tax=Austropuccinia psidii MF-1 TaxID=1389203 RepID=A0A9Q3BSH4_9BASI|nr:hypothetical protein [Austropuccinia psidii MF-1]
MSRIRDWGERAYIHVYRRGLASRLLDQLDSHHGNFDSLQELMDITLELDTSFEWDFFIKDSSKGEELILGYDLLYHFNPIIDWKNVLISYDSSGIKSSTNNEFCTAFNSVALVDELKTPSLPPSFHIPSIKPSQYLRPLRDKVFKEIKDVEEDVAISSLYLFQEDMDLPPLSFNSSLEEQWDEEEEAEGIVTVLKVVPPVYHQHLDAFSKVKAEKLPSHCTCYHHSKLEGLLHPVSVISSLSKLCQKHYRPKFQRK